MVKMLVKWNAAWWKKKKLFYIFLSGNSHFIFLTPNLRRRRNKVEFKEMENREHHHISFTFNSNHFPSSETYFLIPELSSPFFFSKFKTCCFKLWILTFWQILRTYELHMSAKQNIGTTESVILSVLVAFVDDKKISTTNLHICSPLEQKCDVHSSPSSLSSLKSFNGHSFAAICFLKIIFCFVFRHFFILTFSFFSTVNKHCCLNISSFSYFRYEQNVKKIVMLLVYIVCRLQVCVVATTPQQFSITVKSTRVPFISSCFRFIPTYSP